jgi:maltooligosyltrehalose trehalohydrolase
MTEQSRFGPLLSDHGVTFRLWAPGAKSVELVADQTVPMQRDGGWFSAQIPQARAGTRYRFKIDNNVLIPDPGSRFQPDDVYGPSEVIEQAYDWKCLDWRGRPWPEAVFLELHVGTFTPKGSFRAAIEKLDHVAATGITVIELMPLSDFPGRWNWGYDGVLPFAPDSSYGRPDDLKALIDAAHQRGLMVFLDVVYNHFGPEGNYLGRIAQQFFSTAQTPWGGAIDYSVPEVRAFAIENAVAWVKDYRFDGLRLDAVHAIVSPGTPHLLNELSTAVGNFARESGRHIHLVLENDDNRVSLLAPNEDPPRGRYRAQWNDDFHHAWHVRLTGEHGGYYKDYSESTAHIARALAEGFAYQGEPSPHRNGKTRGEPSTQLSPLAFVNFLQNHDQIGNRALGDRLTDLVPAKALEAALAVLLLAPSPPLLFMGEEWGSQKPFPFFCDFKGDLAEAVRKGRKAEFAEAYAVSTITIPDPLAETTMRSAKLDWGALGNQQNAERLKLTTTLLQARQRYILPLLSNIIPERSAASFDGDLLLVSWRTDDQRLHLFGNFSDVNKEAPVADVQIVVWGKLGNNMLPPWSVFVAIGAV